MSKQYSIPWVQGRGSGIAPLFRLYCFPYGGSGASVYRKWQNDVCDEIEIRPVQLPGRENRIDEPLVADMSRLLDALADSLPFDDEIPFGFFGHSMGGIIAFQLAHHLRRHGMPEPAHLFISGAPLPRRVEEYARANHHNHKLPDDQFLELFLENSKGIPDQVLYSEEMMRMVLPILKADLGIMESFPLSGGCTPVSIPMTVFGGTEDDMVPPEEIAQWKSYTTSSYTQVILPGGHYFLHTEHDALLQHVNDTSLLCML